MAIKTSARPRVHRNTGRVQTPTDPVASTLPADNASTGAHDTAGPVESTIPHDISGSTVVRYDTPGPVTMQLGWITDGDAAEASNQAQAKVVQPPAKKPPRKSGAKVETKKQ